MNERAQFLVKYLADQHGICVTEDIAREDISTQVDRVAERMRIQRQSAKYYVTEDYLIKLGDHIARAIREAQEADPRRGLRAVPPVD
ncbi:hypothetical protein D2E70_03470 [Mycobacteroides abscessus]|uniref:hypothetical protein n=1 Tax=Mycobacteroides abscessus TaxID=36809 RepID=UPI000E67924D|nr:hypothetical protein [Mycobacteroides abscessus]RIS72012.1 hypothetical protein D2E70_03470 [Mycobacteroides abscessus]